MRSFLKLAALLCLSLPAAAATWYASPTGSGTACTFANPCTTSQAETNASAGDTIRFMDGTYTNTPHFTKSGTVGAHLILTSDNKWGAKFNGTSGVAGWTFRSDGNYVEIRNIEVTGDNGGNGSDGILIGGNSGNGHDVIIDGNNVHNITASGCHGGGLIHDWSNDLGFNITVTNNILHDIGNPDSGSPCNQVHGVYIENPGAVIYNNIVYRASGYGLHLWHRASAETVMNNTVFACRQSGIVVGNDGTSGTPTSDTNTVVFNNIFINNSNYGMTQQGNFGTNSFSNNVIYGNGVGPVLATTDSQRITGDAAFVNYNPTGTGDYHITKTSSARNAGINTLTNGPTTGTAPTLDFAGIARPQEVIIDIGAYEFVPQPTCSLFKFDWDGV